MKKIQRDYTGKTVFVGIDVHKKTYSVTAVCESEVVKRDTLIACPEDLVNYLKKFFKGAEINSAYEAGFSGLTLHRTLVANGIKNIVVHAASIEISSRDKVKTDKRDSEKIAVQLSVGRLRANHIPTEEMEDRRQLTRFRQALVKEKNRIAAQMKQKANYFGLIGPSDSQRVSKSWIEDILSKKMMDGLRCTFEMMVFLWNQIRDKIKEVEEKLKEQALQDKNDEVYRSVKGVGPISARYLANELGNMSHFASERDLFSYTGLTPCEYSSGEHRRQGHITRQGKSMLRALLVQCAWVAIRYDKSLDEIYNRISQNAGAKRAIIAVARRLVGRMRACFRTGTLYKVQEECTVA